MSGGNWKEMFHACQSGDLELVKYHLKMGVDVNYQHPEYMTSATIESLRFGHLDIINLLLKEGGDLTVTEGFGTTTPLSIARAAKNPTVIELVENNLKQQHPEYYKNVILKILVTGGNRGIGRATAKKLLMEGHDVVIVARDKTQGEAAVSDLKKETGNSKIAFLQGDLSNIESCKNLVEQIKSEHPDIKVLINNAGVFMTDKKLNADGLEISFMVNYLAPYILCKGLKSVLEKNKPARIVNVNSKLYVKGKLDLKATPAGKDFSPMKTYANSKLCNAMFTVDFAKEMEGSGVTINAVHPGVINTGIGDSPKLISQLMKVVKLFWKSPEYGAAAPAWLATGKELDGVNGLYYNEKATMEYAEVVKDEALRNALQQKTEALLEKQKVNI